MLKTLGTLHDPDLVLKFQHLCGLKARTRDVTDPQTPGPTVANGVSVANGIAPKNGVNSLNGYSNGYTHVNGHSNGYSADSLKDVKHRVVANSDTNVSTGNRNGVMNLIWVWICRRGTSGPALGWQGGVAEEGKQEGKHVNGHRHGLANGLHATDSGHKRKHSDLKEEHKCEVTNKFLYYLFSFGAFLGNEAFYITFYPYLIWNVDGFLGRRLCVFWAAFMYLGQATKDIVKWPRPDSPPVFRLEKRYVLEYGMPSTHAMVGAGMPFCLLFLTMQRYEGLAMEGVILSTLWCALVCFSRIYLGMHSILDVLAGLLYVSLLMPPYLWVVDMLDSTMVTAPWAPLAIVLVPLFALLNYPKLDRWSTARGDSTLIVGTATGVMLGYWFSNALGLITSPTMPGPYLVSVPTLRGVAIATIRLVLGAILLLVTRTIIKTLSIAVTCWIIGKDRRDKLVHRCLAVELPTKFISYITIALVCVTVGPQIFIKLGLERESYFHEL